MKTQLALTIPDQKTGSITISVPPDVPTGGLDGTGESILQTGIGLFFLAAIVVALLFLLWAGIQWITSGGDKGKIEAARKRIYFVVIGIIVMALAFTIVTIVGSTFGIEFFEFSP